MRLTEGLRAIICMACGVAVRVAVVGVITCAFGLVFVRLSIKAGVALRIKEAFPFLRWRRLEG